LNASVAATAVNTDAANPQNVETTRTKSRKVSATVVGLATWMARNPKTIMKTPATATA